MEDDETRIELFSSTLNLVDASPELLWQYCDLDRRFEVLLYLMNETTQIESHLELFRFAIRGRIQIHRGAIGGQGYPIMWNDAETTFLINEAISSLEFGSLARNYATEKYQSQILYKKSEDRQELSYLHQYFSAFKEFYRSTAKCGNATLILLD